MSRPLAPDQPTTDRVTTHDRRRDEEFLRRLREADEEINRRGGVSTPEPAVPAAGWDPRDCL